MKKVMLTMMVVLATSSLWGESLTLHEAIDRTLAHHPDVKRFMLHLQQAKKGVDIAYADYLPQLFLDGNYAPLQTYVLPLNGKFHTKESDGWSATLSLRQKIWDFSRTHSKIEAADKTRDIAALSLKEGRALLAFKVKSLYKLLVVQQEAIAVERKDIEAKKRLYEQAIALHRQGLKTKADTYRFRAALYEARERLSVARAAFERARIALSLYTGMMIDPDVVLESGVLQRSDKVAHDLTDEVVRRNYGLQIADLDIEKSRLLKKSAKAAHFGSVDLVASHSRFDTLNSYNADRVAIDYTLPLYQGGRLKSQEQQARIGYQIAKAQKASRLLALKEELSSLQIDIRRYDRTIEARSAQLEALEETAKVIRARYKEGLATYVEVLDAVAQSLEAKLAILQARYARSEAIDRIAYLEGVEK